MPIRYNARMKMHFLLAALAVAGSAAADIRLEVSSDRANAVYRCGERATFSVRAVDAATGAATTNGVVKVRLDNFDGANFAARIRCPVRVAVGFADTTCAPCAVYAAYNAIPVKDKGIVHGIGMGHGCFGKFYSELGAWVVGK